jgi:hypothetical protein
MEALSQDKDIKALIIIFTILTGISALTNVLRYVKESEEEFKNSKSINR